MSHALEADHLAAVSSIATSEDGASRKRLAVLGMSWGAGHSTTLLLLSVAVLAFGYVLTVRAAAGMEFVVGIMLVVLGLSVLWKMRRRKVHFHVHEHGDGNRHFHAHSHEHAKTRHQQDPHEHRHGFSLRAYMVGLIHGGAGSAGLVALAAATTQNVATAIGYVVIFGLGSILGMALLTYTASWPLRLAKNAATGLFQTVQLLVAGVAIYIGGSVMISAGPVFWVGA